MTPRLAAGLALLAILITAIFLRSQHMTDVSSRSPDERTYTGYASRLADEGFGAYREVFETYNGNPDRWIYPSPTRFGHVLIFAGVMRATGVRDGRAGAAASWVFSILSVALVGWIGLRFFHPWVAVFAAAFMACSFGELGMARRAWQDTTFGFCGLLTIYIACEISRRPRLRLYIALCAVGAFAFLTKETAVLSYGLVLVWLAGIAVWESSWKRVAAVATAGAMSAAVALAVWIALAGDVRAAIAAVEHSTRSGAGAWAQQYCSGPWYQFPYLLWIVGPLTAVAALAGVGVALSMRSARVANWSAIANPRAAAMVAFVTVGFVSFASFVPNFQYLRIISPASGAYCLLAGRGLWFALSMTRASRPRYLVATVAAGAALVFAGIHDYQSFTKVVVRSGMEELPALTIRSWMNR